MRRADAILILDGYGPDRMKFGLNLLVEGWAPAVVVSNPRGSWLTEQCARPSYGYDLYCFAPDPPTTKGEARALRELAAQHGWRTIIVVTFRAHISRARFILEQCFTGNLIMVASPAELSVARWAFEYGYQTSGYVRALLQPDC